MPYPEIEFEKFIRPFEMLMLVKELFYPRIQPEQMIYERIKIILYAHLVTPAL